MFIKTIYRLITVTGLLALLLAACGPIGAVGTSSSIHAWVDQPVGGALLPLAPFTLKAHARHAAGSGITRIQFLVNDVPVGSADTDAGAALAYAETGWNPSAPGRYTLTAQAFAGPDFAYSESAGVCVSDQVKEAAAGFAGDCENPAAAAAPQEVTPQPGITPTATTAAPVGMKMDGAPDPVYYGACTSGETTVLAFNVYIDHPESADTVDVAYTLLDGFGAALRSERVSVRSTPPTQTYSLALDMNAATAGLGVPVAAVEFHPEGIDVAGNVVGTAAAQTVKVVWCVPATASQATVVPATKTPIPIKPTFTPLPVDNKPPSIQVSASEKEVFYTTGCGPNSLTVTAHVNDPSGIDHVTLFYNYSGAGAASLPMASIGGDAYQATINAGAEAYAPLGGANGTVNLRVEAGDTAGNNGSVDGGGVPIEYCPG